MLARLIAVFIERLDYKKSAKRSEKPVLVVRYANRRGTVGQLITDERASLDAELIEAYSCVKNWLNMKP